MEMHKISFLTLTLHMNNKSLVTSRLSNYNNLLYTYCTANHSRNILNLEQNSFSTHTVKR